MPDSQMAAVQESPNDCICIVDQVDEGLSHTVILVIKWPMFQVRSLGILLLVNGGVCGDHGAYAFLKAGPA